MGADGRRDEGGYGGAPPTDGAHDPLGGGADAGLLSSGCSDRGSVHGTSESAPRAARGRWLGARHEHRCARGGSGGRRPLLGARHERD